MVFYEVTTMTDKVKTLKKEDDNLYLFNFNNIKLNKILMEEIKKCDKPKYVQLYCTDWKLSIKNIEDYFAQGFKLIYEYVDDLSPDLSGTKELPRAITEKYEYVMKNDNIYVVATARKLEEDVIKKRGKKNLVYSSNGVDYPFFEKFDENYVYESEFLEILDRKKPIVMYYGAIAKWFDYDLIKKIDAFDKYSIVLFGIKYDDALDESGILDLKNVFFMGSREYKVLKNYAKCADVLTIPFKINSITEATSPVKIFEYMALHKPIVITDLNECRQYKSVMIGHDHDEFIKLLDESFKKVKDKKYIELLDKEARENDWSYKAKAIIDLIRKDEK
ncbi:MAG TPA: glycosyltransferase family 1 protein [Firmicutes bacterium]|nr:glycosyltransferase family 1 protein [Bacillota bacterium]